MRLRSLSFATTVLVCLLSGPRGQAQIGKSTLPPETTEDEFQLPPLPFLVKHPAVRKETNKEPAPAGKSLITVVVVLSIVFLMIASAGAWWLRNWLKDYKTCSWDYVIGRTPSRAPPRYAPKYLDAESLPGWLLYGRLFRIYLFPDQIIAIEYGRAGHRKSLKHLALLTAAGDRAAMAGQIRIPAEVQRIADRIAYLDRLDESGIRELAQFDRHAVVVPRSKITFFGTGGAAPWRLFATCTGRLTLRTARRTFEWTFTDRTALLCAEGILRGGSPDQPNTLTTALRLAQPQYEVVDLVAEPSRSGRPRTKRLSV
jgi:hypothetical protein